MSIWGALFGAEGPKRVTQRPGCWAIHCKQHQRPPGPEMCVESGRALLGREQEGPDHRRQSCDP